MIKKLPFILLSILLLAGCSTTDTKQESNQTVPAQGSFPITIKHAFGETIIEKQPERVATVAWGNQDTALALGVVPVGVSKGNFGKLGEHGLSPWSEEAFKHLQESDPVVFDDTDGLDYEAIAHAAPDVILAAYSGLTKEEYDLLSQIAPVVAYPNLPWQTYWREQTLLNAEAMGRKRDGEDLVKEREELIAAKVKDYPEINGKKAAFLWINPADTSMFYAYLPTDPRAAYLIDLGLAFPESIQALANTSKDFSISLSAEQADRLQDVEIIVTYGDEDTLAMLQKDPLLRKIPAIQQGAVVVIDSSSALAGSATPTILSIPYTIDDYLSLLQEAARKVVG